MIQKFRIIGSTLILKQSQSLKILMKNSTMRKLRNLKSNFNKNCRPLKRKKKKLKINNIKSIKI